MAHGFDGFHFTRNSHIDPAKARARLEQIIDAGKASALRTYEHAMTARIEDSLVRDNAMVFSEVYGSLVMKAGNGIAPLTDYAVGQACTRYGMPAKYARELLENESPVIRSLAAENLETLARVDGKGRALVRVQDGRVKAVLSDSYKRVDSRPMIDTFVNACQEMELIPTQGHVTDTRIAISALCPTIFEPTPGEVVCFGMQLKTSDFGAGAFMCSIFVLRLWCNNGATMETAMRQVHLGRKLDEGSFSEKTYALDSQTSVSALNDVIRGAFLKDNVVRYAEVIERAANGGKDYDAKKAIDGLHKAGKLNKGERDEVVNIYNTPDVEMLPPGNSPWRVSNAISWFAHKGEHKSNDRRLDLEKLAGDVITNA
jgi:hypothetical protein